VPEISQPAQFAQVYNNNDDDSDGGYYGGGGGCFAGDSVI